MKGVVLLAALALAGGAERSDFRWTRSVTASGSGPVAIEPDGPMFEHARTGFSDLRVVDARGEEVPWRGLPPPPGDAERFVAPLNSGRRGGAAVALFDLGPRRAVRDRVELDVRERNFVGRVLVSGSDRRAGPFTRLSATGIYDVGGATRARSTTAVFPPTDFRFLSVRATGISRIHSAVVSGTAGRPPTVERRAASTMTRRSGSTTIVRLDLGHRNVPVDEVRITAATARYDRRVVVAGSNDANVWQTVSGGRISRFEGSTPAPIPLGARVRFLRVTIVNGDDPPLSGIRVRASSSSRALVLEGGHARPYTLLYGAPSVRAPRYEFARLPLDPDRRPERGALGRERANPAFAAPSKPFGERYPWLLQAALALAAIAVGVGGFLALRRRA